MKKRDFSETILSPPPKKNGRNAKGDNNKIKKVVLTKVDVMDTENIDMYISKLCQLLNFEVNIIFYLFDSYINL